MAGPLSSEEIEDVVSSVRRLVSNEQSPRRTTRDLSAERLLLTPSLRVVSDVSPIAPLVLDSSLPEAAPVPGAAADPEVADEPAVELVEADWEDELWATSETASLGEAALAAEEAEVLVPPADDQTDVLIEETDGPDESWGQVDWAGEDPTPFIPLRRRAEHLAARLAAGEVLDPEETEGKAVPSPSSDAAVPATDAHVAPDVAPELLEDGLGPTDLADEDAISPGHDPALRQDAAAERMPTEYIDADGTALAVLDEAALQEIVRQMIRDELQGTLGERITRNVRKLVRAEINRALIARDLD